MSELGKYAGFILAAYAATALVLGGLLVDSLLRARKWRREVERQQGKGRP